MTNIDELVSDVKKLNHKKKLIECAMTGSCIAGASALTYVTKILIPEAMALNTLAEHQGAYAALIFTPTLAMLAGTGLIAPFLDDIEKEEKTKIDELKKYRKIF